MGRSVRRPSSASACSAMLMETSDRSWAVAEASTCSGGMDSGEMDLGEMDSSRILTEI